MQAEFETVTTMQRPVEASLVKGRLESEGIPAYIQGDAVGGWFSHLSPAGQGCYVQVAPEDANRARDILANIGTERTTAAAMPARETAGDEEIDGDDTLLNRALIAAIIGLVLLPPILNLYSLYLLWKYRRRDERRSPDPFMKYEGTLLIDALGICLGVVILSYYF